MSAITLPFVNKTFRPLPALVILALVFGTLDLVEYLMFWGISASVAPADILQGIASGLLGSSAFHAGLAGAALGAVLQYCSFICLLGIYQLAAARLPALSSRPLTYGLLYGFAGYLAIHYLILPVTAYHVVTVFNPAVFANGILAQTILIGVPSGLLAAAGGSREEATVEDVQEIRHASASH